MSLIDRRSLLKASIAPLGLSALSGCGGGNGRAAVMATTIGAAAGGATTATGATPGVKLLPVQPSDIAAMVARPETFLATYQAIGSGADPNAFVRQALGSGFSTLEAPGCLAVYAALVAFSVAPSGINDLPPLTTTMQQMLTSSALTCGHFCKLATLLSLLGYPTLIPPDAPSGSAVKPTIHFLVWLAHVPLKTGVHSQLILDNVLDGAYLLLDPFFGFAMRLPFAGAYPQSDLTVIENAAGLLATPINPDNLVMLDTTDVTGKSTVLTVLPSGQVGPSWVYHDALFGSEGWDIHIGATFGNMS
jgi:hypothetical protein